MKSMANWSACLKHDPGSNPGGQASLKVKKNEVCQVMNCKTALFVGPKTKCFCKREINIMKII